MWTAQQEDRFGMCTDDSDALNWATTKLLSYILKCSYFFKPFCKCKWRGRAGQFGEFFRDFFGPKANVD